MVNELNTWMEMTYAFLPTPETHCRCPRQFQPRGPRPHDGNAQGTREPGAMLDDAPPGHMLFDWLVVLE